MNVFSRFERTVTETIWKQQVTSTGNMICGETNCYSNCKIDYKPIIPFELKGLFGRLCNKCNHMLRNHHRCHAKWGQVVDTQVSVDQDMMKKWEAAKDEKEKTAVLIEAQAKVLYDL